MSRQAQQARQSGRAEEAHHRRSDTRAGDWPRLSEEHPPALEEQQTQRQQRWPQHVREDGAGAGHRAVGGDDAHEGGARRADLSPQGRADPSDGDADEHRVRKLLDPWRGQHAANEAQQRGAHHEGALGDTSRHKACSGQPCSARHATAVQPEETWPVWLLVSPIGRLGHGILGILLQVCLREDPSDDNRGGERSHEAEDQQRGEPQQHAPGRRVDERQPHESRHEEEGGPLDEERLGRLQREVQLARPLRPRELPDEQQRHEDPQHAHDGLHAKGLQLRAQHHKKGDPCQALKPSRRLQQHLERRRDPQQARHQPQDFELLRNGPDPDVDHQEYGQQNVDAMPPGLEVPAETLVAETQANLHRK
mmetsp:Transcript_44508/g.127552  ORF Transcript_44508/g.127552 Transcript_44508/m.127552 type:complete len:365 (-) Transcript_44508:201-1295(-)